jgi:hypothetical protein
VLTRSAPIFDQTSSSIDRNRVDSYNKEIEASTSSDRPQVLDYSNWFGHSYDRSRPLSHHLPANDANFFIRSRFAQWKEFYTESDFLLLPQLSGVKNTSRQTAYKYREFLGKGDWDTDVAVNCVDLERLYAETGNMVGGSCELRQAWKFNDLTPRTYFAIGGTAFHHSKYIRQVANALCNIFPQTNFVSRFSVNRLDVQTSDTVFTYDYSSFTSNLTELKYFLQELAVYMEDAPVRIVDSRRGIVSTSIGSILQEYLNFTTLRPEFTVNRYLSHVLEPLVHTKAGMLGVYGNIAISTCLHGLHACQLCDSGDCNCVGDDVLGSGALNEDHFLPAIQSLGTINPSKIRRWPYREPTEEEGADSRRWPYTKRPLERFGNFILHHHSYNLPIFGALIPILDEVHDVIEEGVTYPRLKVLATQMRSLLNQLISFPLEVPQLELITEYCGMIYEELDVPRDGLFPWDVVNTSEGRFSGLHIIPIIALSTKNFWEGIGEAFVPGWHKVPDSTCCEDEYSSAGLQHFKVCIRDRFVAYGEKLGWLKVQRRDGWREFTSSADYCAFQDDLYFRKRRILFDVECLKPPAWFLELLCNEL